MPKFKYDSQKTMDPIADRKYSTTYYRFSGREHQRISRHIYETLVSIAEHTPDEVLKLPLPGFPRTGRQPNYSAWDIVADLHNQVNYDCKDLPSGMLGRWNRLSDALDDDFAIDLEAKVIDSAAAGRSTLEVIEDLRQQIGARAHYE